MFLNTTWLWIGPCLRREFCDLKRSMPWFFFHFLRSFSSSPNFQWIKSLIKALTITEFGRSNTEKWHLKRSITFITMSSFDIVSYGCALPSIDAWHFNELCGLWFTMQTVIVKQKHRRSRCPILYATVGAISRFIPPPIASLENGLYTFSLFDI